MSLSVPFVRACIRIVKHYIVFGMVLFRKELKIAGVKIAGVKIAGVKHDT